MWSVEYSVGFFQQHQWEDSRSITGILLYPESQGIETFAIAECWRQRDSWREKEMKPT